MSILDTKRTIKHYLLASLICFIISFIYELYSHGVYSNHMIFAGLIPLGLGAVFYLLIKNINPFNHTGKCLYNSFVATLTICMYVKGILEIYGTTNLLVNYYLYWAIILLIFTMISVLFNNK